MQKRDSRSTFDGNAQRPDFNTEAFGLARELEERKYNSLGVWNSDDAANSNRLTVRVLCCVMGLRLGIFMMRTTQVQTVMDLSTRLAFQQTRLVIHKVHCTESKYPTDHNRSVLVREVPLPLFAAVSLQRESIPHRGVSQPGFRHRNTPHLQQLS